MFYKVLDHCNKRYQQNRQDKDCDACAFGGFCPENLKKNKCEICLEWIHYPHHVHEGYPKRTYSCTNMADYYFCKYSTKSVSEMVYAFKWTNDLRTADTIKVLSFGCGPCTDLFALSYLREKGIYCYSRLEFIGIDYDTKVWKNIHKDIKKYSPDGIDVRFLEGDVCEEIDMIASGSWIPNVITFQYFLSDLNKNSEAKKVNEFIKKFANYVSSKLPSKTYVVFNDINLSNYQGGGRDYFDKALNLLPTGEYWAGHFYNDYRKNTYKYGAKYKKNDLLFQTETIIQYNPFPCCSSAQLIYKKADGK